ncbi:MAG: dephospho-CoA kinase [Psychroflexus sp.]|jgi:dephospho-CoA kinase|nr:dephospho-CoA kinase [Psychroflexus sp.]MDR9448428.1 dephospho-CoA kinase [Psychroflexus sp.]
MKIVGITGGIGSGKTFVAELFKKYDVPVYVADMRAKQLMNENDQLKEDIISFFGEKSYKKNLLDRGFLARQVFADTEKLEKLNCMVHPRVFEDFKLWLKKLPKQTPYCLYEAAILFERNRQKECDYTILITAPKAQKINRTIKRDQSTKKAVLERMKHQWSDDKKIPLADFVINNINLKDTKTKVEKIHHFLTKA